MHYSTSHLTISFDTKWGRFHIKKDLEREHIFTLSLENSFREEHLLNEFCSISDAICAVSQQRTGFTEWDQLPAHELPLRVHNIASWKFLQNMGTIPRVACS